MDGRREGRRPPPVEERRPQARPLDATGAQRRGEGTGAPRDLYIFWLHILLLSTLKLRFFAARESKNRRCALHQRSLKLPTRTSYDADFDSMGRVRSCVIAATILVTISGRYGRSRATR